MKIHGGCFTAVMVGAVLCFQTLPAVAAKPLKPVVREVCWDGTRPFTTIQAAIIAADEAQGDSVLVCPGTYHEQILIDKAILVASESGAQDAGTGLPLTVIDRQRIGGYVVGISADAELDGFTIRGGWNVEGGGIHIDNASPRIKNCIIAGNESTQYGGGIWCNGRYDQPYLNLEITNCVLHSNISVSHGTTIFLNYTNATVTNTTIVDNTSPNTSWAMYVGGDGSLSMVNSELWNNRGALNILDIGGSTGSTVNVSYSNIETGETGTNDPNPYPGTGNIKALPIFAGGEDYRHLEGSPGIDAGTGSGAPATDLLGYDRPLDGDGDSSAVTDMGAYEFPAVAGGITIVKALYDYLSDTLEVEATSEYGASANLYLQLDTQRPLSWDNASQSWKIVETEVTPVPVSFSVCGDFDSCTTVD